MDVKTVGGVPEECLGNELAGIWSGWRTLGDREVVREASTKGTHVELAYKCLSCRRQCSLEESKLYFHEEVEIWVDELLAKRQVHRASHILKNMGKNPVDYVKSTCQICQDPSLRNYLVQHLLNVDGMDETLNDIWELITYISSHEEKLGLQGNLLSCKSIRGIMHLPMTVKSSLCTELYFLQVKKPEFVHRLNQNAVWKYLLANNCIELLEKWIDIGFDAIIVETGEESNTLESFFKSSGVTDDMISILETACYAMTPVSLMLLNKLCRYGIFTNKKQADTKQILSRLFSASIIPEEFNKILSLDSCNISDIDIPSKLDAIKYFRDNCEKSDPSKAKSLLQALTAMNSENNSEEESVLNAIVGTIAYMDDDVNVYLKLNPIVTFTMVFLRHLIEKKTTRSNVSLRDMFVIEKGLIINSIQISQSTLEHASTSLTHLDVKSRESKTDPTMYDLLNGFKKLDVVNFFKWRYSDDASMPKFESEDWVKMYGHEEKLNYVYYLREARPNMAVRSLYTHGRERAIKDLSTQIKSRAALNAHIFCLRHLEDLEIVSSCISFIKILGIDPEKLRLHVTVKNYVHKELHIHIESLLESIMYNDQQDLKTILNYLECSYHSSLTKNLIGNTENFLDGLKQWNIIVRFAKSNNATIPVSLLNFLASNDAWMEFILACHIFAYPVDQVLSCLQHFKNASMREHLSLSLNNQQLMKSVFQDEQKPKGKGLNYPNPKPNVMNGPMNNSPEFQGNVGAFRDHLSADDLWLVILRSHNSQDPPGSLLTASRVFKMPILTVLATCYEPSSIASYCYSWLAVSVECANFAENYADCLERQIWPAQKVFDLFCGMVSSNYVDTLRRGILTFMPESPLSAFFEFLALCTNLGKFEEARTCLNNFKSACSTLKCNKMIDWDDSDATFLENSFWIETVALRCIFTALEENFKNSFLQSKFLKILIDCDFEKTLMVESPNFQYLLEYVDILLKTDISFNFLSFEMVNGVYDFSDEVQRCINVLLDNGNYESALQLSRVARMKSSGIILAKYGSEFEKSLNDTGVMGSEFWKRCASDFFKYDVCFDKAAEFFVKHAEKVHSHKERYEVLRLALEILKRNSEEKHICDTVEMAMWKSCILAGPESIEITKENGPFTKLKTELLSASKSLVTCNIGDPIEKESIKVLIDLLLDANRLDTALVINTMFNYDHKDLQILMSCLTLAESEISPLQLSSHRRFLDMNLNEKRSTTSINLNNADAKAVTPNSILQEQKESALLLTRALKTLNHGTNIAKRVALCYRLSVNLRKSYQTLLLLSDPMPILQDVVIHSNSDRKLEIASDIIAAYEIEDRKVSQFLAEEIVAHITSVVEKGDNWDFNMVYPWSFLSITELCRDPTELGIKLLDMATKLLGHSHGEKRSVVTLKITVELLIRSHDCFTASCNMEGIASVLRRCQQLANSLKNLTHWTVLVRLLTGVGRFTEMNYVFRMLKEHDQFEFLLGKGLDKVPGLKMALLDFLKKNCPKDKELFNIVSLHYRLYYEIALKWENEAKDLIKLLVRSKSGQKEFKLMKDGKVERRLHDAKTNFVHATQYFLQDNKSMLATRCSHQAELMALQISLLDSVGHGQQFTCILNLTGEEIDRAICSVLNFPQALILTRAYNYHVDWAPAIYSHWLVNGETKYLEDFFASKKLTTKIVKDCTRRYRNDSSVSKTMQDNVSTLVSELKNTECKYVLASQLGLKNIVQNLLEDPAIGSYLKDNGWRKGYDRDST